MPELPSFLQPQTAPPPLALAETIGAGEPQSRTIPAPGLIAQEEDNWCWAAVTQYVLHIVRGQAIAQQDVATAHIRESGRLHDCGSPHRTATGGKCRDAGCNGGCNAQHTLRIVLRENEFSAAYLSEKKAPTFAELKREIDAGRPVPCRVRWSPTAGHFILVVGWTIDAAGTKLVHVRDPDSARHGHPIRELRMPYAQFASNYQLSALRGRINYSYKVD